MACTEQAAPMLFSVLYVDNGVNSYGIRTSKFPSLIFKWVNPCFYTCHTETLISSYIYAYTNVVIVVFAASSAVILVVNVDAFDIRASTLVCVCVYRI